MNKDLAYLCCQCSTSFGMKLARREVNSEQCTYVRVVSRIAKAIKKVCYKTKLVLACL